MTKVKITPGVCGMVCVATAESADGETVTLRAQTDCPAVRAMLEERGEGLDAYELCLARPGTGPLYEYAQEHFPMHCACPTIAGLTKCAEAECRLALARDVSIEFIDAE